MTGNPVPPQNSHQQGRVKTWQSCLDLMVKVLMDWKPNSHADYKKNPRTSLKRKKIIHKNAWS